MTIMSHTFLQKKSAMTRKQSNIKAKQQYVFKGDHDLDSYSHASSGYTAAVEI
jgi:hypothetical protein